MSEGQARITMECRICGESINTSRDEAARAFVREHKSLHSPRMVFDCPACGHESAWTDGLSVEAGDECDEFWCQVCGAETPIPFGMAIGLGSVAQASRDMR